MPIAYPIPGAPWTESFIRECYHAIGNRDRWEAWQYGISSPGEAGYSGAVRHTTATGRLEWQVAPDGVVGIVVCRPGEDMGAGERRSRVVLSVRVEAGVIVEIRTPETRDHRIPDVHRAMWSTEDGPRAEARHGDALLGALTALVGYPAAAAALTAAGIPQLACNEALANEISELAGASAARRQDADCMRDGCTAAGCVDRARADAERDWYAHALTRTQAEMIQLRGEWTQEADPLCGYSADEIVVGPNGQTLAEAARAERRSTDLQTGRVAEGIVDGVGPEIGTPAQTEV